MEENLKRKENESYLDYCKRIVLNKKEYDLDYVELGNLLLEEDNTYSSDNIRKSWYILHKIFKRLDSEIENNVVNEAIENNDSNLILELEMKKAELKEERKRIGLIRSELTKAITEKVKFGNLIEIFDKIIKESNLPKFEYKENRNEIFIKSDNEMICSISDIHYGLNINNEFEFYSSKIFVERLYHYYDKIIEIKNRHNINTCNIALCGDLISGILHNVIRIENSENMIEQIQQVSEILGEFIYKLSCEFKEINIYFVTGNHSRNTQDKKESINGERLENLTLWYLKSRLKDVLNIKFHDSLANNTIVKTQICGKTCIFSHGDNDSSNNIISKMTNMFEEKIDLCLIGHYHNFNVIKQGKSLVITNGAFLCNDEYCINKRLTGEPSQAIIVLNSKEIETIYDVKLK